MEKGEIILKSYACVVIGIIVRYAPELLLLGRLSYSQLPYAPSETLILCILSLSLSLFVSLSLSQC